MKKFWAIMFTLLMVLSLSLTTGCETAQEASDRTAKEADVPAGPGY